MTWDSIGWGIENRYLQFLRYQQCDPRFDWCVTTSTGPRLMQWSFLFNYHSKTRSNSSIACKRELSHYLWAYNVELLLGLLLVWALVGYSRGKKCYKCHSRVTRDAGIQKSNGLLRGTGRGHSHLAFVSSSYAFTHLDSKERRVGLCMLSFISFSHSVKM